MVGIGFIYFGRIGDDDYWLIKIVVGFEIGVLFVGNCNVVYKFYLVKLFYLFGRGKMEGVGVEEFFIVVVYLVGINGNGGNFCFLY